MLNVAKVKETVISYTSFKRVSVKQIMKGLLLEFKTSTSVMFE